MKITKENNITKLELESPEAYSAFKMGLSDCRNWSRHPETSEMARYVNDKRRFEYIVVEYGDTFTRMK